MITFEVGGRKVSPNQFCDAIMAAALTSIKGQLEDKIKRKLTAAERQQVKITVKGKDIEHMSIHAEGPDEIIAKLKTVLGLK